ncbi:MAG: fatty acid desaturase family protein [Planctomycetaceae bacterium]
MLPASPVHLESHVAPSGGWLFWLRFLLFPLLAVVGYPGLIAGFGGAHWVVRTGWVACLSYCWFCIGGSFHESVHQTLFRGERLNRAFGRVLGALIFIPYTVYRETHRRHHAYLNTPADYELWPYSDPRTSRAFRRAFVWFDLLLGVVTAPYIYGRIYFVNDPRLPPDVRRTIGREYLAVLAGWAAGIAAIVVAADQFGWSWSHFDPVWLLPLVLSPMLNTGRKFVEHLGMTSPDPLLGTRTVLAGNPVSRLLSFFNFDIAIHGPHHRHPRAQHVELGARLEQYRQAHPQAAVPVFPSYTAAFRHLWPSLWKNPATGISDAGLTGPPPSASSQSLEPIEWEPAHGAPG